MTLTPTSKGSCLRLATTFFVLASSATSRPLAQPSEGDRIPEAHLPPARKSVDAGSFAPFSMSARSDTQKALAHVQGGYDAAKGGATFESVVEASLARRLSLRAGASYISADGKVRPLVLGKVDVLRQTGQGVDLAIAGGYEPHGFNTVPAALIAAAAGRSFGAVSLLGNVGMGVGTEQGERYADGRLAAMVRVLPRLHLGLDSRARVDIERDNDEPEGEPDWEVVTGPFATISVNRFVLSGGAGVSAVRKRFDPSFAVGALMHLGLGAVF